MNDKNFTHFKITLSKIVYPLLSAGSTRNICPNMTEKLSTGMYSKASIKQTNG